MTDDETKRQYGIDVLRELIGRDTDDCVEWPLGRNPHDGYGRVRVDGHMRLAHRVALLLTAGAPPIDRPFAIHGPCHNRACVNPRHLRWGSRLENENDKRRDGTRLTGEKVTGARLTAAQVDAIRSRYAEGDISQRRLAAIYGVAQGTIGPLLLGRTWKVAA